MVPVNKDLWAVGIVLYGGANRRNAFDLWVEGTVLGMVLNTVFGGIGDTNLVRTERRRLTCGSTTMIGSHPFMISPVARVRPWLTI